jgi:hypothetical protein
VIMIELYLVSLLEELYFFYYCFTLMLDLQAQMIFLMFAQPRVVLLFKLLPMPFKISTAS